MMLSKKACYILVFFYGLTANGQSALYNSGNIQIHQEGLFGLHTDLINDGIFDENRGLTGFYGTAPLTVSGAFPPSFFDIEIANSSTIVLNTGINVENNVNFIIGSFQTDRTQADNYLNFLVDATYTGSSNTSKIDGYSAITDVRNFIFPVGDAVALRPLILNSESANSVAKCAYFFENPNSTSSFDANFNTGIKAEDLGFISSREFWRLEGSVSATVQLSWNERSTISLLTEDPTSLMMVGWSKTTNQWERLSEGAAAVGDLSQGFISSQSFIPNDYEILTFAGSADELPPFVDVDNYLVTPNGDGNNDFLIIEDLELSSDNTVQIFDRFGLKVFEMKNYTDEFRGFSNTGAVLTGKEKGLPIGVYFFTVQLRDLDLDFQGFLYLAR